MLSSFKRKAASAQTQVLSTSKRSKFDTKPLLKERESEKGKSLQIPKKKVASIYLACPPNVRTGGPEAMHQLCNKINMIGNGTNAYILYLQEDESGKMAHDNSAQILEAYETMYSQLQIAESLPKHSLESTDDVEFSDSLIIWPECWTHFIDHFDEEKVLVDKSGSKTITMKHQSAIWWLSVDNNKGAFTRWDERQDILHLYQSEYAREYIIKNLPTSTTEFNTNFMQLTEYIPSRCHSKVPPERNLDVLYNPLKGMHFTDAIRKRSERSIKFNPIGGDSIDRNRLTPEEVTHLLRCAKVYIDFGPHPGMDRLPREASLAGCIVITNTNGSAQYSKDVPIPSKYKIKKFDVDHIHRLLKTSLEKFEESKTDFDEYRTWISEQEGRMDTCVKMIINCVTEKRKS